MTKTPKHIAIIMDGNGRWAERRGYPRVFGHVRGASRIKPIVREADRLGVKALTLYAFSTENWSRPETELSVLWKLLVKFLKKEEADLMKNNVRLRVIGEIERLSPTVREVLDPAIARLSKNTGLQLNFAVSYGSRREILKASQNLIRECSEKGIDPSTLTEADFERHLWTSCLGELSNVDFMIRTSGEIRISNFLLWQAAYAEYLFLEKCWPDFSAQDLTDAVKEFASRDRRFGGIKTTRTAAVPLQQEKLA